mgnify:CR=1 FL=1
MGIRRCPATVTTFRVWKSEYQITAGIIGFWFRRGLRIDTDACHACAARGSSRNAPRSRSGHGSRSNDDVQACGGTGGGAALMAGAVGVTAARSSTPMPLISGGKIGRSDRQYGGTSMRGEVGNSASDCWCGGDCATGEDECAGLLAGCVRDDSEG